MGEVLPAIGLNSMAAKPGTMDRSRMNSGAAIPAAESSDELMTAFSRGSTDAFTELFTRYNSRYLASIAGELRIARRPKS